MLPRIALFLTLFLVLVACNSTPQPTRTPRPTPEETPTLAPLPEDSPSVEPGPTADAFLHVDGMATVVRDVEQMADPVHPNHEKENRNFEPIEAGTKVLLADKMTRKQMTYWQVYAGSDGPEIGWIPQLSDEDLNLEPYQPDCPTEFPLTALSLLELDRLGGLACFGQTELTLSGRLHCDRAIGDGVVGGPILDSNRSCILDNQYGVLGEAVTSLLENPPVDVIDGQYLIRGHFDDPQAQLCGPISFGSSLGTGGPPGPGTIMFCRTLFVATNAISQD